MSHMQCSQRSNMEASALLIFRQKKKNLWFDMLTHVKVTISVNTDAFSL